MLSLSTPSEVRDLQAFGWGKFTDSQIADKAKVVRARMDLRSKPSAPPRISVVVPAHRERDYILGTLLSLASQTHGDVEFTVVSNGEPYGNETQQIAEAAGFKVIHEAGKGWANAHQAGLETVRGEIYATTDADTLHRSVWLTSVDDIFTSTRCVAATGHVEFLGLNIDQILYRITANVYKAVFEHGYTRNGGIHRAAYGANSFYLRQVLNAVGGYRDLPTDTWADTAILRRVLPHGGEVRFRNGPGYTAYASARRINVIPIRQHIKNAIQARRGRVDVDIYENQDVR